MAITFTQEIVYYTGNGTLAGDSQNIPSTYPLDVGVVVVQVFCTGSPPPGMRFTGMTTSSVMGSSSTSQRLSAPGAFGFTVSNAGPLSAGLGLNVSGVKYVAIIWRDTSTDNRHLRVGSYIGAGDRGIQAFFTSGFTTIYWIAGAGSLTSADAGRLLSDGVNLYAQTVGCGGAAIPPPYDTCGVIDPGWIGGTGLASVTLLGGSQTFNTGINISHLWIWGVGDVCYKSVAEMGTGDSAMNLVTYGGGNPVTGLITAINVGSGTFTRGNSTQVNTPGGTYYWFALDNSRGIDGANIFRSYGLLCTAAATDQKTGLGFQVEFGTGERYLTSGVPGPQGMWYKSANTSHQSGATSTRMWDNSTSTTAVTAVGNGTIDIGALIGTNGDTVYGYVYKLTGTVSADVVIITGSSGVKVSGGGGTGATPTGSGSVAILKEQLPGPMEIHGNQWGIHRFDIKPRREETS